MLDNYITKLENMKSEYQQKIGHITAIKSNINNLKSDISIAQQQQELNNNISSTLKKAAEISRDNTKDHLEKVVTSALQFVLGKGYEFEIDLVESRGAASAEFYLKFQESGHEIKVKPEDSTGGGVIDIISTALRFAFLELLGDPVIQSSVILDEPSKMVSEGAAFKMGALIKELNNSFGRQIIMSTHNEVYGASADNELYVSQVGAYATVKEMPKYEIKEEEVEIDDEEENID